MLTQLKLFYYFYETKINNSGTDTSEQQQLIYNEID